MNAMAVKELKATERARHERRLLRLPSRLRSSRRVAGDRTSVVLNAVVQRSPALRHLGATVHLSRASRASCTTSGTHGRSSARLSAAAPPPALEGGASFVLPSEEDAAAVRSSAGGGGGGGGAKLGDRPWVG
eukprot:4188799-Prymnesium_polylepis.1